jgi:hypothetical protein
VGQPCCASATPARSRVRFCGLGTPQPITSTGAGAREGARLRDTQPPAHEYEARPLFPGPRIGRRGAEGGHRGRGPAAVYIRPDSYAPPFHSRIRKLGSLCRARPRQGPAWLSGEGPGGTGSKGPGAAGGLWRPGEAVVRRHAPGRGRARGGVHLAGGKGQRETGPDGGLRTFSSRVWAAG